MPHQPSELYTADQVKAVLLDLGTAAINPVHALIAVDMLRNEPEGHEARTLRYRLKTARKELAKLGTRIYDLRCQLAEVRGTHSKIERSSYRTLLALNKDLNREINEVIIAKRDLQERLDVAYGQLRVNGIHVNGEGPTPTQQWAHDQAVADDTVRPLADA